MVVGTGNSGVDIAGEAYFFADQAYISVCGGYHFVSKHLFGEPVDVFASKGAQLLFFLKQKLFAGLLRVVNGDLRDYGLPKPDHKIFQIPPILNTQLLNNEILAVDSQWLIAIISRKKNAHPVDGLF